MKWSLDTEMLLVGDVCPEMPSTQQCSQNWIILFGNGHSIPSRNVIKNWLPASLLNASVMCTWASVGVTVDMVWTRLSAFTSFEKVRWRANVAHEFQQKTSYRSLFTLIFCQPILVIYLNPFQVFFFAVDMVKWSTGATEVEWKKENYAYIYAIYSNNNIASICILDKNPWIT